MPSNWQSIPGNQAVFDRLIKVIQSGKAIAFIGAGASAGLYPLWPALIRKLAEIAIDEGEATPAEGAYWTKPTTRPDQATKGIKRALDDGVLRSSLSQIFAPKSGVDGKYYTPAHGLLLQLAFRGMVTTNYDGGLLMARDAIRPPQPGAGRGFTTWMDEDAIRHWLTESIFNDPIRPILFAHGYYERSDTLVLAADDYGAAYRHGEPFLTLMKALWAQKQLVFVGFGFTDRWLEFIAGQAITESGGRSAEPRHFAITELAEDQPYTAEIRRAFKDRYNAATVLYPVTKVDGVEDHSALLEILTQLVGATGASGSGPRSGNAVSPGGPIDPPRLAPPGDAPGRPSASTTKKTAHEMLAIETLAKADAYLQSIPDEIQRKWTVSPRPQSAPDVVEFFARSKTCSVEDLFLIVRRALIGALKLELAKSAREQATAAASALFCLAACRLVNERMSAVHYGEMTGSNFLIQVPDAAPILCGIIATALTGMKLEFVRPSEDQDNKTREEKLPYPASYFHIAVPGGWDISNENLERALYLYVVDGYEGETCASLNDKRLDANERATLLRKLKDFSEIHDLSLVITLDPRWPLNLSHALAETVQVLLFIENAGAASEIFGIPIAKLRAHIGAFWEEYRAAAEADGHEPQAAATSGEKPMTPTPPTTVIIKNNNVIATGERAVAQAGSGNTAHTGDQSQMTPETFADIVRNLAEAIRRAPEPARAHLMPPLTMIEAEVKKPQKSENSAGLIKGLLDNIKLGATGLENGSKIIEICNRAYQAVGPLFGLPPSPLP